MSKKNIAIKTIYRARKSHNFTALYNEMLQNQTLSYGARGLMCFILSHPDCWLQKLGDLLRPALDVEADEDDDLFFAKPESTKKIYSYVREAKAQNYMGVWKFRDEKGQIETHTYWVTDDCANPPDYDEAAANYYLKKHNDNSPLSLMGKVDENPATDAGNGHDKHAGDNSLLAHNGKVDEGGEQLSRIGQVATLSKINNINNNYYNNNINNNTREGDCPAAYADAARAIEAYNSVQEKACFQKSFGLAPSQVETLSNIVASWGLDRWLELLEKAENSDFCRGDRPGKFQLSLAGMMDPNVLGHISQTKLKLGPQDPRWQPWLDYAVTSDKQMARIMTEIAEGASLATDWSFPSSKPPVLEDA